MGLFGLDDIARILALFISIILHELAHGFAALANGDRTTKNAGRLTLNPAKHFDLTGVLMMMFLRFGYAKPVPVNYYNFKRRRLGIFTVSIAGVTVNLLLAFLFMPLFLLAGRFLTVTNFNIFVYTFLNYMVFINIILCVFNLLPLYPLDGFRVVESVTRYNNPYTSFMRKYGSYILMGLILISIATRLMNSMFPSSAWEKVDILSYILSTVANWIWVPFNKFWSFVLGGVLA